MYMHQFASAGKYQLTGAIPSKFTNLRKSLSNSSALPTSTKKPIFRFRGPQSAVHSHSSTIYQCQPAALASTMKELKDTSSQENNHSSSCTRTFKENLLVSPVYGALTSREQLRQVQSCISFSRRLLTDPNNVSRSVSWSVLREIGKPSTSPKPLCLDKACQYMPSEPPRSLRFDQTCRCMPTDVKRDSPINLDDGCQYDTNDFSDQQSQSTLDGVLSTNILKRCYSAIGRADYHHVTPLSESIMDIIRKGENIGVQNNANDTGTLRSRRYSTTLQPEDSSSGLSGAGTPRNQSPIPPQRSITLNFRPASPSSDTFFTIAEPLREAKQLPSQIHDQRVQIRQLLKEQRRRRKLKGFARVRRKIRTAAKKMKKGISSAVKKLMCIGS